MKAVIILVIAAIVFVIAVMWSGVSTGISGYGTSSDIKGGG